MKNLFGVAGRIGSGKDEVGLMIQYLTDHYSQQDGESYEMFKYNMVESVDAGNQYTASLFKIMKFAGALKHTVCLLLGCTMEDLENREFKEKPLGEEWTKWKLTGKDFAHAQGLGDKFYDVNYFNTEEEAERVAGLSGNLNYTVEEIIMTPRLLLQLLGTEAGRNILHPNIWVNALFGLYKEEETPWPLNEKWSLYAQKFQDENGTPVEKTRENTKYEFPKWIITDMRFPNELDAVREKGGITIRVLRYPGTITKSTGPGKEMQIPFDKDDITHIKLWRAEGKMLHPSEHALDGYIVQYEIINDGSIDDLLEKVRAILIKTGNL